MKTGACADSTCFSVMAFINPAIGLSMVTTAKDATATETPTITASRTISLTGFISFCMNFISIIFITTNKIVLNITTENKVSISICLARFLLDPLLPQGKPTVFLGPFPLRGTTFKAPLAPRSGAPKVLSPLDPSFNRNHNYKNKRERSKENRRFALREGSWGTYGSPEN